jgi:hypothetical protein
MPRGSELKPHGSICRMADAIARPHPCTRDARPTLLAVVSRCADCVGDGPAAPAGVPAWKADVNLNRRLV